MSKMPKPALSNEGAVKAKVKKLLDNHGWFWFMPPANGFGKSGIADILAIKAGMFMAIETKYGVNTPTPQQRGFLHSVAACDHFALVVTDQTLLDLSAFLSALDQSMGCVARGGVPPPEVGAPMADALKVLQDPWMKE